MTSREFLACVAVFFAGPCLAEQPAPSAEEASNCSRVVVRAHFDDPAMIAEVTWWTEPWEIDRDAGYMVVDVDNVGLERLRSAGFRTEVDEERTRVRCTPFRHLPGQKAGIPGFPCYRTVEETFADAEALAEQHPDLVEWIDIGDSWELQNGQEPGFEGFDLMVLRLTNRLVPGVGTPADPDRKPILFVEGGIHAREMVPPELLMRFAEGLVAEYGSDADTTWLLDEHEIHLLFFFNPDGRKRAEAGLWWRKNANNNYCTDTDVRGADLNRNFDYQWSCCGGSSDDPCDLTYHGAAAASEPETQAVQDYLESIWPNQWNPEPPSDATGVFIDLHAYGRYLAWPWFHSTEPGPNNAALETFGSKLAFFNFYEAREVYGTLDGGAVDFAYGRTGVASFLFELGGQFFEECIIFEEMVLPGNLAALNYAAKVARTPYETPFGPDVREVTFEPGMVVLEGEPLHILATADDTRFFNWSGNVTSQNIASVSLYLDRPPWGTEGPTSQGMEPVDGAFDSRQETVQLTLDTTGLAPGRHTVFIQATDSDHMRGVVNAEFFWIFEPAVRVRHGGDRMRP